MLQKSKIPTYRVAFFTHNFLEPTHYAIEQVLSRLDRYQFHVFAKRFMAEQFFKINNVSNRTFYTKGNIPELDKCKFDFVHAIYDGKTALRAGFQAKTNKLPFILSFHGGFDTNAKIFDKRYTQKTQIIAQESDVITVITKSDVRRLKNIGITKDIQIVPVPIDFNILPKPIKRDDHKLIIVGRLISKKGIDIAIKALLFLPKEYHLTIIGYGEKEAALMELAKQLDVQKRIQWLGLMPLNEMLNQLNKSSILLQPSRVAKDGNADGTPQIILWAQAMRIPIISTNTGSIPDIIKNNETGILNETENSEKIASAVIKLSNKKFSNQIILCAQKQVIQNHSLYNIMKQWEKIYRKLSLYGSY